MSSIPSILQSAAASNGVPYSLLYAQAQQESSLNPNAYNPNSGATGLMQLEPATIAQYGVTNPTDPVQSANGGAAYMADLFARFGDWLTALAAYDWGPTHVANAQAQHGSSWLSYAPAETQNYVSSILSNAGLATGAAAPAGAAAAAPASIPAETIAAAPALEETPFAAAPAAQPIFLLALLLAGVYFAGQLLGREAEG